MIKTTDRMKILRDQKHEKGARSGFDRALLGLGISLKTPRKRTMKQTEI